MPIGIIVNAMALVLGGIIGTLLGSTLKDKYKMNLELMLGLSAIVMGVNSVILMQNMPAVILAVILGGVFGTWICLQEKINRGGAWMQKVMSRVVKNHSSTITQEEFKASLLTIIVLFCAGGTGIYGSIVEGISGDHTILITKAILDFFTAVIFACNMGAIVSLVAIPQFIICMLLFLTAGFIYPYLTPVMINDFKACGGILMVASGFRMLKLKMFPTGDMIPAMLFVMPLSWLWVTYFLH